MDTHWRNELRNITDVYTQCVKENNGPGQIRAFALMADLVETTICQAERLAILGERERIQREVRARYADVLNNQ